MTYFLGDDNDIAGRCKSLSILKVKRTENLTARSTRLAIEHLPNLKILDCHDSVQVLSQMFREGVAAQSAPHGSSWQQQRTGLRQFSLTDLHWDSYSKKPLVSYERGGLWHAVQLCPFVDHVDINVNEGEVVPDSELLALLHLQNLRHLEIARIRISSFKESIVPILEKFGRDSLEILELSYLNNVDVAAIVRHCSNLRSLTIFQCNYGPMSCQPTAGAIDQLGKLESLTICQGSTPTAPTLAFLMRSCPNLVSLDLANLVGLTDQVIQEAIRAHGFSKLEKLRLSGCSQVTSASMDLLFNMDCPFEKVSLDYCSQLKKNEAYAAVWKKKALENNWKLSILSSDSSASQFGFFFGMM